MSKKRKICRSFDERRRKQHHRWIGAQIGLAIAVAIYVSVGYPFFHPKVRGLSDAVSYADIEFDGLMLGKKLQKSVIKDSETIAEGESYLWNNIRISVDGEGKVKRLTFNTISSVDYRRNITIDDVDIKYRGYPLRSVEDFEKCFGESEPTTNQRYKNYSYYDDRYVVNITTYEDVIYNIELYYN